MKRINHLFCTLALGLFLSAAAHAQDSGTTGDCTWRIDGATLYIDGAGAMANYSYGVSPWHTYRSSLHTLIIGVGVTSIGTYAFADCTGFTGSLNLPAGVTSIGMDAFSGCSGFTGSLTLPAGVTAIGGYAFRGCSGFTGSLTLPEGVTSIGAGTFSSCSGLTGISVDAGNTAYSSADGVLFNKAGTVLVTCPAGKTGAYVIPATVTSIGFYAFDGCSGLTGSLNLPAGLTSIGDGAFLGCRSFTGSLNLPAGLTSIGYEAFRSCSGLTGSLNLPAGVTSIRESAFSDCSGLTDISVDAGNTAYSSADGVLFNKTVTVLVACPAGKTGAYVIPATVTSIEDYAFRSCSGLTGSLNLPEGLTSIGDSAFRECSSFTGSLTLPAGLTSIGAEAFYGCSGFTGSLNLPAGLTSIGYYAFRYCNGFTAIYAHNPTPPTLGSNVFDGWNAAADTLYVPAGSLSAYSAATQWSDFTNISEGIFTINITGSDVQTELATALAGNLLSDVASLKITGGAMATTDFTYIRSNMAATLQELDLSGATLSGNALPDNALQNCTGLQTFVFPAGVTAIGASAFFDCSGLTGSLNLPAGVISIGEYAFSGCNGLTGSLTLPA
ncbi:MAG: leucine-rich repeat domain-containing protein, partial [Bacteroidales bacterium]|nr:leucine-rich repeat domain-containing protein [Bacteroidales bacterium]